MSLKRYWSALAPVGVVVDSGFDAKLSPEDVIEMQTIDADCNDCRHFERGQFVDHTLGVTLVDGKRPLIRLGKAGSFFLGTCRKFQKPTIARPMQYTGHECFEHRRRVTSDRNVELPSPGDSASQ